MRRTPNLRIVTNARRWGLISVVLLVVAIGSLATRGLELSLDFVGGSSFRIEGIGPDITPEQLRTSVESAGVTEAIAQVSGTGVDRAAVVRTESLEPDGPTARAVRSALIAVTGVEEVQETFVGPDLGAAHHDPVAPCVGRLPHRGHDLHLGPARPQDGDGRGLPAMAHDVVLTIGLYALLGFTVSPATVIALLTILGYSLYDTVVIFDRVKDNAHTLGQPGRRTVLELVNVSLNEVVWRSVNTTISSILPVGCAAAHRWSGPRCDHPPGPRARPVHRAHRRRVLVGVRGRSALRPLEGR
jgi:preprotein translocase subunit SecF